MPSQTVSGSRIVHDRCRAIHDETGSRLRVRQGMRPCWQISAVAVALLAIALIVEPSHGGSLLDPARNFKQYQAKVMAGRGDGLRAAPAFSDGTTHDLEPLASPTILVSNETKPHEPDTDIFALMSGNCSTLKIAGRDFTCKSVAFFHSEQGRTNFTIALDDSTDDRHIISFSGENGRRDQDNLYELPIDQMLLNSKDRPKVDGLPVPFAESSMGICRQLGNFAAGQVSSVSCDAIDKNGRKYELRFESDGSPIAVRKVRLSPPTIRENPIAESSYTRLVEPNAVAPEYREAAEKRRAEQIGQLECRRKAAVAKILPRDRTAYIIQCLAEFGDQPTTTARQ
jgi:hypothetical protein